MIYWVCRLLFAIVFIFTFYVVIQKSNPSQIKKYSAYFIAAPLVLLLIRFIIEVNIVHMPVKDMLPLYPCALAAVMVYFSYKFNNHRVFTIALYWSVIFASVGLLIPSYINDPYNLSVPFSWALHVILLINIMIIFAIKPELGRYRHNEWLQPTLFMFVYIPIMYLINHFSGTNFIFLNRAPIEYEVSLLGGWPYYMIISLLFCCCCFCCIDLIRRRYFFSREARQSMPAS